MHLSTGGETLPVPAPGGDLAKAFGGDGIYGGHRSAWWRIAPVRTFACLFAADSWLCFQGACPACIVWKRASAARTAQHCTALMWLSRQLFGKQAAVREAALRHSKHFWGVPATHERQALPPQVTQWANVHIERVPPGWRPLLVFLNTKSGPQTGVRMRRRFLRCLNPLQVVHPRSCRPTLTHPCLARPHLAWLRAAC